MDEESATETTSFMQNEDKQNEPSKIITRRLQIENKDGEHSLNLVLVVEDFRVAFYLGFVTLIIVGVILTKAFTKEDHHSILKDVYGISNACSYFDFPPSTYVLPILWMFDFTFGVIYAVTAIFRIRVAYLENKLTMCEQVSLILAYVYVAISLVYLNQIFAVVPKREEPVSMLIHTIPYINFKVMFCVLQIAVVYFGLKVSWVELKLPRWFKVASVVHIPLLIFITIAATIWIINALGDMGEKDLLGKGLWWSVRNEHSKKAGQILVNVLGMILGIVLPVFQAFYICRSGVNTHAVVVAVSDNRPSAQTCRI